MKQQNPRIMYDVQAVYAWSTSLAVPHTTYPVRVMDDDSVGSSEVEAQSSSSGTEQEHHALRIALELGDVDLSIGERHGAIQSTVTNLPHLQIVCQDVQHGSELGEH